MRTFELADDNGNVATIEILNNMSVDEAKDIMLMNGHNDGANFEEPVKRFIYRGVYFYEFDGGYCVDYSNQDFCCDTLETMKEFIESPVFL